MQENKVEVAVPRKRHFFKFHEKYIQSKYEKMQKKMAKSKSVDALSNLSEDYDYKDPKHCSTYDLRESDETESDGHSLTASAIVEQVTMANATYQDFQRESSISELVEDYIIVDGDNNENEFFGENFSRMSFES